MSVSLESRVTQLIKAVTGKSLKLAQAAGWGNDDKYFYYNPKDLENVSDDEVLGRILQQLGKQMFIDNDDLNNIKKADTAYRHLWDSLEANRADRQLANIYAGTNYYANEIWNVRKFTENPITKYTKVDDDNDINKWLESAAGEYGWPYTDIAKYNAADADYIRNVFKDVHDRGDIEQNDAWEFCFNIHAYQNGEKQFDFTKDDVADNFKKALPFIEEYLNCNTFSEAQAVYPKIKKYYPKPNSEQQNRMDIEMQQTQGLSSVELSKLTDEMEMAAEEKAKHTAREANAEQVFNLAGRGENDWKIQRNLARYVKLKRENLGIINTLAALLRSILKDNAVKRFARPFKRGKLDAKRMYKYLATDNLRIFKKPKSFSEKKYTMAIVVDQSGSMQNGNLSSYALTGAIILAEVFEQLGMPYELLGFRDSVFVYKKFDGALKPAIVAAMEEADGGTNDINALEVVDKHMKEFDGKSKYRKGVFIITDGDGYSRSDMQRLS